MATTATKGGGLVTLSELAAEVGTHNDVAQRAAIHVGALPAGWAGTARLFDQETAARIRAEMVKRRDAAAGRYGRRPGPAVAG